MKQMKMIRLKILILVLVVFLMVGWYEWFTGRWQIINPLSKKNKVLENKIEVVGFLPSWMVGKTRIYGEEVDKLIFLGVEVDSEGELVWDVQGKKINSEEYLRVKNNVAKNEGKNILGIKQFGDDDLDLLIGDKEKRDRLINELEGVVLAGNFDGVNVDFEYQNSPVKVMSDDFVMFLRELREANLGEISLDVFANTVIKGEKEGLDRLLNNLDQFIVMGYDFHRPGSNYAGPVAPIGSELGEPSLGDVVNRINLEQLDRKKIVLALPLYGYEWRTEDENYGSKVVPGYSQMASYKRAGDLLKGGDYKVVDMKEVDVKDISGLEPGVIRLYFDEIAKSPWMVYKEEVTKTVRQRISKYSTRTQLVTVKSEEYYQIYFENLVSMKYKFDLIKENGLGGLGFWALGYEGEDMQVWRELEKVVN
jgi:spore germination protein YaaH